MSSTACQSSALMRISRPSRVTPALLTRIDGVPSCAFERLEARLDGRLRPPRSARRRGPRCRLRQGTPSIACGAGLARRGADDARAAPAEFERDRATDAARGTGDEREFVLQACPRLLRRPRAPHRSMPGRRARASRRSGSALDASVERRQHLAGAALDATSCTPLPSIARTVSAQRTGLNNCSLSAWRMPSALACLRTSTV